MKMPRGGWRPGAGRPPRQPEAELHEVKGIDENSTPLEYMLAIIRDPDQPDWRRDRMAKAAAPYCHMKRAAEAAEQPDPDPDTTLSGELIARRKN
jgi:phage terminase small subunit